MSSVQGLVGNPVRTMYSASKHALEGYFKSLRFEVAPFNIKISVVEPGFFKTNLHHAFEYAVPVLADYDQIRNSALTVLQNSISHAGTPEPVMVPNCHICPLPW